MQITRLYTGHDLESHFETQSLAMDPIEIGKLSAIFPASQIFFGEMQESDEMPWHNAPCKQYVIMLAGAIEIELGNGQKKIFKEGELLLAEDISGRGHYTRAASKGTLRYLVIQLAQ